MRKILFIAVVVVLAACSKQKMAEKKVFKKDWSLDKFVITTTDTLGNPLAPFVTEVEDASYTFNKDGSGSWEIVEPSGTTTVSFIWLLLDENTINIQENGSSLNYDLTVNKKTMHWHMQEVFPSFNITRDTDYYFTAL